MSVVVLRHSAYWGRELMAGNEQLILLDLEDAELGDAAIARYDRIYRVPSWNDLESLARVAGDLLTAELNIAMIYSPTEYTQQAAGYLRSALGLDPFAVFTALATRDKRVMKQLAVEAGLVTAGWRTVHAASQSADIGAVLSDLGLPVVAKPVDGFGSMRTDLLNSQGEIVGYADKVRAAAGASAAAMFVCEQFVAGEEYHADALIHDGKIVVLTIARYLTPPREIREGKGPSLSISECENDAPELYGSVRRGLSAFAERAKLRRGPVHLEFFSEGDVTNWGAGGLVFSEIAGRIGGGYIADLVGARCGINLRVLTVAEGSGVDLAGLSWRSSEHRTLGMLNLIPNRSGVISELPGVDDLTNEPDVVYASVPAHLGDLYEVGVTSAVWTAVVIFGAPNPAALLARAETLVRRYPVLVD